MARTPLSDLSPSPEHSRSTDTTAVVMPPLTELTTVQPSSPCEGQVHSQVVEYMCTAVSADQGVNCAANHIKGYNCVLAVIVQGCNCAQGS